MNIFSIYTAAENIAEIQKIIDTQFRLNEVVTVTDLTGIQTDSTNQYLIVNDGIRLPIDWNNEFPPYLFPLPLSYSQQNLLAILYARLNNYELAYACCENNQPLLKEIDTVNCIQNGIEITPVQKPGYFESPYDQYRFLHNQAITIHYGNLTNSGWHQQLDQYYASAFEQATNDEWKAFTGKHRATYLLDQEELNCAEKLLESCISFAISEDARHELMSVQYAVWMKQLAVPYDKVLLEKIKNTLWQVLQYQEKKQNAAQSALLLIDASHIANITDSFAESLGYISRAINLLDDLDLPELLASAHYRKGTLLYTWSQNGNPQFLKPAMEAYQRALKVFTKEQAPDTFAEIQHHLGVIYSEIPDEVRKKSIWAAVSISSFNEALSYFTRESNPYEYARVCNNFANALTKYPDAKLSDNYAKALSFYRDALEIRTAALYPGERTLTILNFLEAAWQVAQPNEFAEQSLFKEMTRLASEVKNLVDDDFLRDQANRQLLRLEELRLVL
ncbi:hypothetical protein [Dyadobacter frigoris]|uniref:Tetratricopeptide repeat protein n=1 Tax=Dyadobacter frigoris TaxID=2576211 RepID=A0A4V6BI57_9BACT|nr:hypothetical protein [Dyadobacter frigoris]TKT87013.1 hypothetical protein FDK13_30835 [Dyadobacter frigoris]GLU52789.1 hypothetical protein Dfri01_22500 [Dyadobacter frigoris]